ncbi:hypothetical protein [Haladaptatus cibarius]|uniref:hypothetical protein n=1 Tax=Haladaptatus cibarius TaxID=453847 RepID=UPI001E587A43|nr:hypothetical protein [Haladaptatus cibarius]
MVTLWLCRVPVVYYFSIVLGLGSTGIWLGVAIGHIVGAIGAGLWFTRGTWKQAVISDPVQFSSTGVEK